MRDIIWPDNIKFVSSDTFKYYKFITTTKRNLLMLLCYWAESTPINRDFIFYISDIKLNYNFL